MTDELQVPPTPPQPERIRRSLRVESEALIAAVIAGIAGGVFAGALFWGRYVPIWDTSGEQWSVGSAGVAAVIVSGLTASAIGYWRSRRLPGQEWRKGLPRWKTAIDAVAVAAVHTSIVVLAAGLVFFVLQVAFRRLAVDGYTATGGVTVATALAAYLLYLGVSQLTTITMSQRLLVFMAAGVLVSMMSSADPIWWRYNFSLLGSFGDRPSLIFNVTLIVAGALVTTFALYVDRDLRTLHDRGVIRHAWSAPVVTALFIAMGIALGGIGLVPVNLTLIGHNVFAVGVSAVFGLLLLLAPVVLRGMPWQFFATTVGFLLLLVGATWMHFSLAVFNLTAFELFAFVILFGWISIFVRFIAVMLGQGTAATAPTAARPSR